MNLKKKVETRNGFELNVKSVNFTFTYFLNSHCFITFSECEKKYRSKYRSNENKKEKKNERKGKNQKRVKRSRNS